MYTFHAFYFGTPSVGFLTFLDVQAKLKQQTKRAIRIQISKMDDASQPLLLELKNKCYN